MRLKPVKILVALLAVTTISSGATAVISYQRDRLPYNPRPEEFPSSMPIAVIQESTLFTSETTVDYLVQDTPNSDVSLSNSKTVVQTPQASSTDKTSESVEVESETTSTSEDGAAEESPYHEVEESYFDDALFIGDSRTVGLSQYGRLGEADYFANVGMSVFNLFTTEASDTNFSKTDLSTLLSQNEYGKIYLMLGINELGYPMESLMKQYQSVVEKIQAAQPDAKIILCANLNVAEEKTKYASWLTCENVKKLNDSIQDLADEKSIYYLDANPLFCDENGYFDATLTVDGVHPTGDGYQIWADWLQENGV